jgi:hypothetical protein
MRRTCFRPGPGTIAQFKAWLKEYRGKFNSILDSSNAEPSPILKAILGWLGSD